MFSSDEIAEVVRMIWEENLDIRSVTLSVNTSRYVSRRQEEVFSSLNSLGQILERFKTSAEKVESRFGVTIVTKRTSVSPSQVFLDVIPEKSFAVGLAEALDRLAEYSGIDFIGGHGAYVERGMSVGAETLLRGLADSMNSTKRVASFVNAASTIHGVNMDAINLFVSQIMEMAPHSSARTAITSNIPGDVPFVPAAHHGLGFPDMSVNVAVSGPGVVEAAIRRESPGDLRSLHETVKRAAFKVTRLGELIGREVSRVSGIPFGSVDLSLAPSPSVGDSVAGILESMGLERVGAHGTIAALYVLMDAVKKGGAMATSSVGGLSGAFIPVSEDSGMVRAVLEGSLNIDTLVAMSAVCNTGIDMVAVEKSVGSPVISGLIADVLSLGVSLGKSLGLRLIPTEKAGGETIDLGGLLGTAVVMSLRRTSPRGFIGKRGFIPPGIKRLEVG